MRAIVASALTLTATACTGFQGTTVLERYAEARVPKGDLKPGAVVVALPDSDTHRTGIVLSTRRDLPTPANRNHPEQHLPDQRDPPGWKRIRFADFSVAVPPVVRGQIAEGTALRFGGPGFDLRFDAERPLIPTRCTLERWCLRLVTRTDAGEIFTALEERHPRVRSRSRPWRLIANIAAEPARSAVAVEAHCSTLQRCHDLTAILRTVRLEAGPADAKAVDWDAVQEPEFKSPHLYKTGINRLTTQMTPAGWARTRNSDFSIAIPRGLPFRWHARGQNSAVLTIKVEGLDMSAHRTRNFAYPECAIGVPCFRYPIELDMLPGTAVWAKWPPDMNLAMERAGLRWAFAASVALEDSRSAKPDVVQIGGSCATQELCELIQKMASTVDIE